MLTLLRDAVLFDPLPRGCCDLLLAGGRVAAVGRGLEPPPRGWPCEVVALDGRTVIPGLVDLHVHLLGGGGEGGPTSRVPRLELPDFTTAGVTSVVGLLGADCVTRSLADLLAAARGLEALGIRCWCHTGGYQLPLPTITGSVRGDIVHVDRIVAVGEVAVSDHRGSHPGARELLPIAADAHVAGMITGKAGLLHLHLGDGPTGLGPIREAMAVSDLPRRVFHPTHCNRSAGLWDEALVFGAEGGWVDITAFPEDDPGVSAARALVDWLDRGLDPARITLSSDAGGSLPIFDEQGDLVGMGVGRSHGLLDAVRGAVALGVPLERALAPCTRNAAGLYRLSGRGGLSVGDAADLVVLDDALSLDACMAGGRWLVRDRRSLVPVPFASLEATP
jgi:beta-aspartyl-dipeptidase (metallo-type)